MAQAIDLVALIPVGRLADRVGHGLILGAASILLGLGVLGVGVGPFPLFAIGCACLGLGLAGWMLPLGVIRDHTPVGRLAWRTGLYRVGVDSAIFLGPLLAGTLGGAGESVLLVIIGGPPWPWAHDSYLASSDDGDPPMQCYRSRPPPPDQGDLMIQAARRVKLVGSPAAAQTPGRTPWWGAA